VKEKLELVVGAALTFVRSRLTLIKED